MPLASQAMTNAKQVTQCYSTYLALARMRTQCYSAGLDLLCSYGPSRVAGLNALILLLKIIQLLTKNIFKQFLKAKVFDNFFSLKSNFSFVTITINNKSKKVYIEIKFEFNDDFIYSLTNDCYRFCIFNIYKQAMFVIIYDKN